MGCFLACFGFKEKKKRRKPGKKSLSGEQVHQSYVPLDSDVSIKLDIKENITSDSCHLKEKAKKPAIQRVKKKVRFNLNVEAYEPMPDNDDDDDDDDDDRSAKLSEGEEVIKWEFNTETKGMEKLQFEEEDAVTSSITSYPASYRYQNCRDDYDEEDNEFKMEENDSDFDDIEDSDAEEEDDAYSNQHDGMPSYEDFPWELNLLAVKSDNEVIDNQIRKAKETSLEHALDLQKKELQGLESKSKVRDRSQYVFSVLNPVENLSQWKVVKAKTAASQLKCQKENLMSQQDGESLSSTNHYSESTAFLKLRNSNGSHPSVDASLSNWLSWSKTQTTTKNSSSSHLSDRNVSHI